MIKWLVSGKKIDQRNPLDSFVKMFFSFSPYNCGDCGKSYKDSASFKRHRLSHTGERPYPCKLCSEAFIDSKSLRRHRETAHPTAVPDPELDSVGDDEEDDELDQSGELDHSGLDHSGQSTSAYSSFESREEDEKDEPKSSETGADDS